MSLTSDKKNSDPKINNGNSAVGAHHEGIGQMRRTIIRKFDPSINQPEVIRVTDPYTGFAQTIVNENNLVLTQAEYNSWKSLTS